MARGKKFTVKLRRKREGKTDYKARLNLLKSGLPRMTVRKSLNNVLVQIITFEANGDRTVLAAHSRELIKAGWKGHRGNIPSAYLTGYLCGVKAKKKGIKEAVLDMGLVKAVPGSSTFAALKGAIDAGLQIPHNESIFPKQETLQGKAIADYATKLSQENKEIHDKQFGKIQKNGLQVQQLPQHFEEVKAKLDKWQEGKDQ